MSTSFLLWWCGLSIATVCSGQTTVPQWSVYEINLTASGSHTNPYVQSGVTAMIHGPGATSARVTGFWNGNNTFKVRFTPTIVGRWTWSTTSPDPGLNGRSGSIQCTAARGRSHGFLRRDAAHPSTFIWDDGTRYFMWGQTYYDVLLNVMDKGNWKRGVDNSMAHRMNKIRLHVFAQKKYKPGEETTYPQVIPYAGTFSSPRRDELNLSYWQGLDEYVRYLESKGLVAELIVFNPYGDNIMWGTQAQDERFLRYIVARYAAFPNVIWCLCNEWNYSLQPQSYFEGMGEVVRREDPWAADGERLRPLSIHQQTRIDFNFFRAKWLVHAVIQYGVRNNGQGRGGLTQYSNGDEWGNAGIIYNLGHNMPVVNDEYGYLGEDTPVNLTQAQHRRAMWGIATAGGYGSAGDFRIKPTGNPEVSGDWADALEYDDLQRLVEFFTSKRLEYWKMSSQNSLKTAGTRVYVLAETGRQYLIYAATGGTFSVNIAPGSYRVRQYDPRTGHDVELGDVGGGGSRSFKMPDANDWVIYLQPR